MMMFFFHHNDIIRRSLLQMHHPRKWENGRRAFKPFLLLSAVEEIIDNFVVHLVRRIYAIVRPSTKIPTRQTTRQDSWHRKFSVFTYCHGKRERGKNLSCAGLNHSRYWLPSSLLVAGGASSRYHLALKEILEATAFFKSEVRDFERGFGFFRWSPPRRKIPLSIYQETRANRRVKERHTPKIRRFNIRFDINYLRPGPKRSYFNVSTPKRTHTRQDLEGVELKPAYSQQQSYIE